MKLRLQNVFGLPHFAAVSYVIGSSVIGSLAAWPREVNLRTGDLENRTGDFCLEC